MSVKARRDDGRKTGRGWPVILVVAIGFIFYRCSSTDSTPPPAATPQTATPSAAAAAKSPAAADRGLATYGMNGLRNDWPKLTGTASSAPKRQLAKNYYVVLDDSGSMQSSNCAAGHGNRLLAAIDALAAFVEGVPAGANVGVMSFDGGSFTEALPLAPRQGNDILKLGKRMSPAGDTPLATAMTRAYEALRRQAETQQGYGEYHLVVITDGNASQGEYPDRIVQRILTESPVDVHTIGFCIGTDHVLNQPRYLSYQSAGDEAALRRGLQDVLAEAPEFTVSSFQ